MYSVYCLRRWNATKHHLYRHGQHWVYRVRRWIDLQYHYQCSLVYGLCDSVRSRKYLSVHSMYRDHKQSVYGL